MSNTSAQWLKLGRISGVHGVRGWVKVESYAQPPENIVRYQPWRLQLLDNVQDVLALDAKVSGKALVVKLEGIDDRDQALALRQHTILIDAQQLPELEQGQYYWHQLEGLQVVSQFEGTTYHLGKVDKLLETGANDVLVVIADDNSIDARERLIPYLPNQVVSQVDLATGIITVDWDPSF